VARWSLACAHTASGNSTSRCGLTRRSGDANTTSSTRRGRFAGNVGAAGDTSLIRSGTSMSRHAAPVSPSLRSPAMMSEPRSDSACRMRSVWTTRSSGFRLRCTDTAVNSVPPGAATRTTA
jgi:hypothetical protein